MKKRIIVAGAGHGGLAAAALIAQKGFDVTVFEKKKETELGYDWTDIFAPGALDIAGIPMPEKDKFTYKDNMTFYSPNCKRGLVQNVPVDQLEIKMERSDIYSLLVEHAKKCGVSFKFECEVNSPLVLGNRVVGIKTSDGDFYADLVIDAAGIDSPVRKNLPASLNIEKDEGEFSRFYVYRAFYNKACEEPAKDVYKVYMLPQGKLGIGWVASEEDFTDVLIGRFSPLSEEDKNESLLSMQKENPRLGTKVVRGGQNVSIPVRQPLSVLVADGYAAIGDSAFMTVPIIGSGIANSFKAARILADVVTEDKDGSFSAATLWKYQREFFKKLGSGLAGLACVKLLLTKLKPEELDYMFETGVLTADDLTIGADSTSLLKMLNGITVGDIANKVKNVVKDKELLKKILSAGERIAKVTAVVSAMPRSYTRGAVEAWSRKYRDCFKI